MSTQKLNLQDITQKINDLSPEKRALLERLLKKEGVEIKASTITPQERDGNIFPLSFAQQRLWFLDQLEPGSPFYNIPSAVRLTGALDIAALERSLNEIVRRHESLRTTFSTQGNDPIQIIAPELDLLLPVTDLRHLPPEEREAKALRLAQKEARKPFDLAQGPLLRVALFKLDAGEQIVLLTMHHIISDGWSMGVFIQELAMLYDAFSHGRSVPLTELPIQYVDFAHWQREQLQGEALEKQLSFWRSHLSDSPPVLELPTDRPRPAIQGTAGATRAFIFPKSLADGLAALGQKENATIFMTLLSAFQMLLHRYTGQEIVNVGSPIANRNRAEIEGLIGFFVNTLVLPADMSGDPSFRDLLRQVRETTLGAFAHQDLPFEMLVEELQPERDMSHTPLFQVMFILQNAPMQARKLPELTLSPIEVHSGTSTFDITLVMAESPDGLSGALEYSSDLFDETTIERLIGHFQTLLEGIVADPDRPVSRLPLLPEAEQQQMLVGWNDAVLDDAVWREQCVHQLFEAQVLKTPDAVAVVVPAMGEKPCQQLTYRELNQRANRLAHYIQKLSVGPETLVGVCVERSLEMLVGALGVLKAGGAYLPLDPMHPQERLAYMLQDSGVSVVLTHAALVDGLPTGNACVLCLDSDWETIAQGQSDENPVGETTPAHLAYTIYTSGSAGQSKGVMVQHHNLVNAYLAWEEAYDLRQVRSHLQMANFAFDVFSGDMVRALCSGGKLVVCPREWLLAPEQLYGLMVQEQVDCAEFVPAVLRHLIQHLDKTGQRLNFLRVLTCGSDSWYVGEYKRFLSFCGPETRLVNSFGLTEATIDSSYFESLDLTLAADLLLPIGRPFANMQLYVLDKHLQPTPVGVPGEIYVGGQGVARGYHNRPRMTAERFVPNPFAPLAPFQGASPPQAGGNVKTPKTRISSSASPPQAGGNEGGTRLYKTGDQGRYLPTGDVEFLGRMDYQVKIRGYRIEPGEIEAALERHPAVHEVVIVAVEAAVGDKRLAAYAVADPNGAPTTSELRRFLQERLPDYMVPSAFMLLDTLPLTSNGKMDRRSLPEPEWSRRDLEGAFVAPRTPVEEMLVAIWVQVLGVEQVGVYDNFFELGGHSLLATQLVSRARETFEIELPLRKVFEAPTIALLAEYVEIAQRTEAGVQAPPITPVSHDDSANLPLSFSQQRLWFLDQLEPNSPLYNVPDAVRITGAMDVEALESTLNEIVRRHQVLRTTFPTVDGKPLQVIASKLHVPLTAVDLSGLPRDERETEALRLAQEEARQSFNLAREPLMRSKLLRLGEQDHIVLLTMHHIVSDGWSTGVLVQEIAVLYRAFSTGAPSPLPDLPIQYADFAHWQRNWLQGEVLQTQLDHWKAQLGGSPPLLELPTDRPRPVVQTFQGDHRPFSVSRELSQALKALSQREGTTMFMTLLAAFQTLLYRYSGQEDISVGTPIANRNRADIEGLIGFFVNTLVMRADLSGAPSFRELLAQVREVTLGAYAHQDLPFDLLVDELQPQRNLSYTPLFQVMFFMQNAPLRAQSMPGLSLTSIETDSGTAKFDLSFTMVESEDGLLGSLRYSTDLFDGATIERMLAHFHALLQGIVADPECSVSRLALLTDAERERLVFEWNDTAAPYPQGQCFYQLFDAQVERTPNAVAATFGREQLTFAELNQRANQLARYLQNRGVGPETLVGVCVGRSLEMLVGLLGIFKAGGAYLPLDPDYPQERLTFMLEDAGIKLLLTQERLMADLPTDGVEVIRLDADWGTVARESDVNPLCVAGPENLAYVIYTSGSTGLPKGVMVENGGLVNYLWWVSRELFGDDVRHIPLTTKLTFDASLKQLFAPLLNGRSVWIMPDDVVKEPAALLQEITGQPGVGFNSVPSLWQAMLDVVQIGQAAKPDAGLARLFVGGEAVSQELIKRSLSTLPHLQIWNLYGPTEATANASAGPLSSDGGVTIGRPFSNVQLYVLDTHMQPSPIGVSGELYIGGVGVARGYLNRPELTAERFVPDPFAPQPSKGGPGGTRLYKTGDLVRYLPDGRIQFLGRRDHQVKVRGFRIELGEIEAALAEHPALKEVVVLARQDPPGTKRLVAYLVPETEPAPIVSELRDFVGAKLPEYMVPAAFVVLPSLPLMPNGKVDRRALPAPDVARPDLHEEFVMPNSDKEQILADIWADVLNVDRVGARDNFFELGGDSILSIQVVARANQAGLHLTPRQIFESPTVTQLAAVAGNGRSVKAEQGIVEGPLPFTPIQRWFFERDLPNPHLWRQTILLKVQQRLDSDLLQTTVKYLLAHHDVFRLRLQPGPAGWEQVNAGIEDKVPFVTIDLSKQPLREKSSAIETGAAWLRALLNLTQGSLLQVGYFDLGPEDPGRLLITAHHIAIDGVSWRILLEDFQTVYMQLSRGEPVRLPPKTTSFRFWAQRLSEYAQSDTVLAELDHWLTLGSYSQEPLPVDVKGVDNTEASARSVTVELTDSETRALLQDVPSAFRTEINDVLLTALAQAYARWTGSRTLLVDLEGHGREDLFEDVDLSRTVGWFTSLYPVRLDLKDTREPGQALTTIKEQLRQVPDRGMGYGLLRYLNQDPGVTRQMQTLPRPEISFNYLGQFKHSAQDSAMFGAAPESTGPERSPMGVRGHQIEISGSIAQGRLYMEWVYSDNFFHRITIRRVADDFLRMLRDIINASQAPDAGAVTPSDFPLAQLNQKKLNKLISKLS